ncbi:hypothetical protein C922_00589 [Plasmodium inui San Antonio 1]|uniref:Uncharacterized protein n=1 Tax=Plasmodium inui San Antonio 1 TaxID=1237626 RepID=W7ATZ3_9APIC|nr:hypothetical protein C922_00589 [Plasmodium inui San Antonio 1]EUD68901.1 hypothetical protein C922_00589 [Plasmodium inui San Antonio 1]
MTGLQFFEKVKKTEIQEIEKKLLHIHKCVSASLTNSDLINKGEIIFHWKKCHTYVTDVKTDVTDVKTHVTEFFENYKNFEICNEINLSIGEYFMYLIIYWRNVKIKKNPLRILNLYIFVNNKWKDKLIYHFLKNLFLKKDDEQQDCMNCKTLIIEYFTNNYGTFREEHIGLFYTNILRYINNKLKINFLKKNQNYLNIFANFLITYNGNATLQIKSHMLNAFLLIAKNLKKILLQFPFDKDICTHVCLIYQKVKNVIEAYRAGVCHLLAEKAQPFPIPAVGVQSEWVGQYVGAPSDSDSDEEFHAAEEEAEVGGEVEAGIHGGVKHPSVLLLRKYLCGIKKIQQQLQQCDNVIKEKKKEYPFLLLCKYRSILIIKYKNVRRVDISDNLEYFILFFKIRNLLCEGSKNPFFIFLCIDSLSYWLQKNEKLQYIFEDAKVGALPKGEASEMCFLTDGLPNSCADEWVGYNAMKRNFPGEKVPWSNYDYSNGRVTTLDCTDLLDLADQSEDKICEEGATPVRHDQRVKLSQNYGCSDCKDAPSLCGTDFPYSGEGREVPGDAKMISDEKTPEGVPDAPANISPIRMDELVKADNCVKISSLKIHFESVSQENRVNFMSHLYRAIMRSLLVILKKYSWYNIKIIWKSCISIYEFLLSSKKNTFIKKDVCDHLTYIIFNQEKKKKYMCLSLLLKYFKESMCEKNVLEYLFYCFFQNDDFFMFSLYDLIKQCIKHIFVHAKDKHQLYYIFLKNILITDNFSMKTFYIKKFIELFYKHDSNYVYFVLNKEYSDLRTYFDMLLEEEQERRYIQADQTKPGRNNVDSFIGLSSVNSVKSSKEMTSRRYFLFLMKHLLERKDADEIAYNGVVDQMEDNIFLNYRIVKDGVNSLEKNVPNVKGKTLKETFLIYNFHSLQNIAFLELYTLCTLRKYECIEAVNYKSDYFYQLRNNVLLNVKILNNFFYFSNDEFVLSILSFICENKYLNLCDLYLFRTFLITSITNISRTSRDAYRKYIFLFFEKFFIYYQRVIEMDKRRGYNIEAGKEKKTHGDDILQIERSCQVGGAHLGGDINIGATHVDKHSFEVQKVVSFLYGNVDVLQDNPVCDSPKNVYSTCIYHSADEKHVDHRKGVFLYNYYLMNIFFVLFKNTNKDMSIEATVYCSDILNTVVDYCAHFKNLNFFFFLFNAKTTWKEFYLISKEIFFKTVNIILLKRESFSCLNNAFLPLVKSHRQVDHSFYAFLLRLCFISLNHRKEVNKREDGIATNLLTTTSSDNHEIYQRVNNLRLNPNRDGAPPCDFFSCLIKCSDVEHIKEDNKYLINYVNYLFGDSGDGGDRGEDGETRGNHNNSATINIPLYIFESFIHKLKRENIVKLTKHEDVEDCEMYKLAYYINEFILYLKDNMDFRKEIEGAAFRKQFCEISLCSSSTYLNFEQYKLFRVPSEALESSDGFHLILLKVYVCNVLHYFISYLNFLFLNESKSSFFDCRGHLIFEDESEKEATSIIIWLSIKYISILFTSIVDFSFKFNITTSDGDDNRERHDDSGFANCDSKSESMRDVNYGSGKKNISLQFFHSTEIHLIIQILLCLLLHSKHIACQQYLSDCLLDICRIIVMTSCESMQTIPLFYIYIIFLIFKNEGGESKCTEEGGNQMDKAPEGRRHIASDEPVSNENPEDAEPNFEFLTGIISRLNKMLTTKEGNNVDVSEILSAHFLKGNFTPPKWGPHDKPAVQNATQRENKRGSAESKCKTAPHANHNFKLNDKLNMLIWDDEQIKTNFLRKSSNMCLALSSLAKSYKAKEQYIIYSFVIKIIINYLLNGNNKYKKVICVNLIKHIYTTIDNKTLYEYMNDIYRIALIYYKSRFFCLKSSSTSLYNILTKRLLAKLNYSYHVSSNMYYFCTGSKRRIFKNINLTFFDLLNSVNLLKIFLNVFIKKGKFLNAHDCSKNECKPFFDYSNFYAQFIPILIFLSNIIIFNNDDYFLLRNVRGDLLAAHSVHQFSPHSGSPTDTREQIVGENESQSDLQEEEENAEWTEAPTGNHPSNDPGGENQTQISNINIYFLFVKHLKKLLTYGNYFVQVLICRIIVNVYMHIYLKLKKQNLIFNFLNKIVINAMEGDKRNFYLLLFIEFVRRKESKTLVEENKKKFRKIFFQFLFLFVRTETYVEVLLILQILNILYSKISISLHKNVVAFLFRRLTLYQNDMFISVLVNELLMKITKRVENFVALLDIYASSRNEKHIESFLYNWFLHTKKRQKKELQIKEKQLSELSNYSSFKFFSECHKKGVTTPPGEEWLDGTKRSASGHSEGEVQGGDGKTEQLDDKSVDQSPDQSVDERMYIYLYLLLFQIAHTYKDNIKINKYCFSILLTIVNFISIENLFLFERMQQYYMEHVKENYLDKYMISYSYLICVKYFSIAQKAEGKKSQKQRCEPGNRFIEAIYNFIEREKESIASAFSCNWKESLFNYAYFYCLLFLNLLSHLCNKNSVTYTKYFVKVFMNYGIVEYHYDRLEEEEEKMKNVNAGGGDDIGKDCMVPKGEKHSSLGYPTGDDSPNWSRINGAKRNNKNEVFDMTQFSKNNYPPQGTLQMNTPNYALPKEEGKAGDARTTTYTKYKEWYKTDLNQWITQVVKNKVRNQNITFDVVYVKNSLKHVRGHNLFTAFFVVLYSFLIFMLNDENELIRYKAKIAVLQMMRKNTLNVYRAMKDIICVEFFIYYLSKWHQHVALHILTFCICQTKSCIRDSFYYNPVKLFDQEKYNLYINNVLLNHLFVFYYLFNITAIYERGNPGGGINEGITDFYRFVDTIGGQKKDALMRNVKIENAPPLLSTDETILDGHDLCVLKDGAVWQKVLERLVRKRAFCTECHTLGDKAERPLRTSCFLSCRKTLVTSYMETFLIFLRMGYIPDIKKSLDDYSHLLRSYKNVDLFDSNFVICWSNLFNKIIILLINIFIFFQKNIDLYDNSYFYEEINMIKLKTESIYGTFKLVRHEMNPFLLKSMELLLSIMGTAFLKNGNFFSDIYTLLYSLKSSV